MRKYAIWLLVCLFVCPALGAKPPSLSNVGNTCYFNAIIQNVYNLEPITEALLAQKGAQLSPLIAQYTGLIAQFRAGQESGFRDALKNLSDKLIEAGKGGGGLAAGTQGDATEAFDVLTKYKDGVGLDTTVPVFSGSMGFLPGTFFASTDKAAYLKHDAQETALYIQPSYVPKKSKDEKTTRQEVLEAYFGWEVRGGLDTEDDKRKGIRLAQARIVGQCPEILMVWVKVFYSKGGGEQGRYETNFDGDSFLQVLDVAPYLVAAPDKAKDNDTTYNLIGVVCQSGGLGVGHYTALVKDQYDPMRPWYRCNDSTIDRIEKDAMAAEICTKGYVFFYRKKSAEENSIATQWLERFAGSLYAIAHTI